MFPFLLFCGLRFTISFHKLILHPISLFREIQIHRIFFRKSCQLAPIRLLVTPENVNFLKNLTDSEGSMKRVVLKCEMKPTYKIRNISHWKEDAGICPSLRGWGKFALPKTREVYCDFLSPEPTKYKKTTN